jgi:hypothetical protein
MKHESIFPQGVAIGGGINKREYLAAHMLHGMIAGTYANIYALDKDSARELRKQFVKSALGYADALLEALDGKN